MTRKDLIFIAIIVVVVGIFVVLSMIGQKPKTMTERAEHAGVTRKTANDVCLACHAPNSRVAPMPPNHPKKGRPPDTMTCFACHRPPASVAEFIPSRSIEGELSWLGRQLR
ncbi:MAG: hypothetical protein ACREDR_04185 [Blastocatellia bacterium]